MNPTKYLYCLLKHLLSLNTKLLHSRVVRQSIHSHKAPSGNCFVRLGTQCCNYIISPQLLQHLFKQKQCKYKKTLQLRQTSTQIPFLSTTRQQDVPVLSGLHSSNSIQETLLLLKVSSYQKWDPWDPVCSRDGGAAEGGTGAVAVDSMLESHFPL